MSEYSQPVDVRLVRLAAAVVSVLALCVSAGLHAQVDATRFGCAQLEQMVRAAGRLSITAVHVNPHSGERATSNSFVSGRAYCEFIDEWPSPWKIRARDGEVCIGLSICLPRDLYDDPLWRRRGWHTP